MQQAETSSQQSESMQSHVGSEKLHRSLKLRHMNMIAIGGGIGTGLFFASGSAVSQSGPGGALLAYSVFGIVLYFLMTSLGEMATVIPVAGSFETYATRFVDPALGFVLGWNYWFNWAFTIAAELVAASFIIKYWFPDSPATLWSVVFLVVLFLLNALSVKAYGESEFWFAGIKVATIVIFLIVGVLMIFGIMGGDYVGFSNWTLSDGSGNKAPFIGGFFALLNVFLVAGWSLLGSEVVGLAAGESEDPGRNVPKAIKMVFWRLMLFYVGSIAIIGFLIPFNDPSLLNGSISNIAESPFTLVFKNAGFAFAASLMNAVVVTSVLSCGNSGMYAASRMLYSMAITGKAPGFLGKINKRGVPINALYLTAAVAALSFFSSFIGEGKVYVILYSLSGLCGFFAWLGIALCHYRFRKAYVLQGYKVEDLKYKAKWYPFGPIFAMILCVIVIFGANSWVFQDDNFTWFNFIVNYALIPIFVLSYFIYKHIKKTKIVKLSECDFSPTEE